MVISVIAVLLKVAECISLSPSLSLTVLRFSQSANAEYSIVTTEFGVAKSVNALQPANA